MGVTYTVVFVVCLGHDFARHVACSFFLQVSIELLERGASGKPCAPLLCDASALVHVPVLPKLVGLLLAIPPTVGLSGTSKVFVDVVRAASEDKTLANTFEVLLNRSIQEDTQGDDLQAEDARVR